MTALGVMVSDKNKTIAIPHRSPSGRRHTPGRESRNAYAEMHRLFDRWNDFKELGVDPDFGTVIGRMFILGKINTREASAARIYGQVMGKYDRYHTAGSRVCQSPSYQRGSRGRDDEIERREAGGTIKEYEKRAKRAMKAYLKLTRVIPTDSARRLLDDVCLHETFPIGEKEQNAVKQLLGAVAGAFGLPYDYTQQN